MRMCLNKEGERQDENVLHGGVFKVNALTIIASESYSNFAGKLQTEIAEAVSDRPIKVTQALFEGLLVANASGEQKKLNDGDASHEKLCY